MFMNFLVLASDIPPCPEAGFFASTCTFLTTFYSTYKERYPRATLSEDENEDELHGPYRVTAGTPAQTRGWWGPKNGRSLVLGGGFSWTSSNQRNKQTKRSAVHGKTGPGIERLVFFLLSSYGVC